MKLEKGKSLYELIGVEKDASKADLTKAYRKLALRLHPDKNPDDSEAAEKFHTLRKVYDILSDPDRRKVYDETGSFEDADELAGDNFSNLVAFYRSLYRRVTEDDIAEFQASFRGSEEERAELLELYEACEGDMPGVMERLVCSREAVDSHRFMDAVQAAIEKGAVQEYAAFKSWAKKVARKPRPTRNPLAPDSPPRRGTADGGGGDLVALIQARQGGRLADVAAALEDKHGARSKKGARGGAKKKSRENVEPSEEEFLRARQRIEKRRGGK
ncbi:unnamed protein product [Pedinophyceae sp. YPF-701]|nr:unnamed protein product [Pedinophyceae sp. YPF-701]